MKMPVAERTAPDSIEVEASRTGEYIAAEEAARRWARDAAVLAGMVGRQKARETDSEYQARLDAEVAKVIKRVTVLGEFYLVRAGNTRKGSGTFYTRPELAVPTVHRTLEPLCYDKAENGTSIPKEPEVILALKLCDTACGSASFLVAGLDYLTDALFRSLCHPSPPERPGRCQHAHAAPGDATNGAAWRGDRQIPA